MAKRKNARKGTALTRRRGKRPGRIARRNKRRGNGIMRPPTAASSAKGIVYGAPTALVLGAAKRVFGPVVGATLEVVTVISTVVGAFVFDAPGALECTKGALYPFLSDRAGDITDAAADMLGGVDLPGTGAGGPVDSDSGIDA